MRSRIRLTCATFALAALATSAVRADDKDLLKKKAVPPNVMIIFGNAQSTNAPLNGTNTMWDGDADSPTSKMGAGKRVLKRFIQEKSSTLNIGLSTFSHNPNVGSITLYRKHWLYSPTSVDFPGDTFAEPVGTIERWGDKGEGPCTTATSPACTSVSPAITVGNGSGLGAVGPFFGPNHTGTAYVNISSNQRVAVTLTEGDYGDAFSDGTLTQYLRGGGTYAIKVHKVYQELKSGTWGVPANGKTPKLNSPTVDVLYVPASTLTQDLFYTSGDDTGKEIGFLSNAQTDFDVNANCSGWEFQSNSNPEPLIKVPRDYTWGSSCNKPPQVSYPCVSRLMRPQATIVRYLGAGNGYATTYDHDNPGYNNNGSGTCASGPCYADGCDPTLVGAVDAGLNVAQNNAILTNGNSSQVPLTNLLKNVLAYYVNPSIDGFSNGKRTDDPDAACRTSSVILVYDNFNGCQNDSCSYLTNQVLSNFKAANIPVYVIGLGSSANSTSNTGMCIASNSGAILPDGTPGYFPVTDANGLYQALNDISSFLTEATKDFASASVSSVQAGGDQIAYLATFNATSARSIWNGRINAYMVNVDGSIPTLPKTITDPNDPLTGKTIQVPSNDPSILKWNAGVNLTQTPGTGATSAAGVLQPGASLNTGTYQDGSTNTTNTIPTYYYPGRKIVWSLPVSWTPNPPTTLPIANTATVPEQRFDFAANTSASYWATLKALLGPQSSPPNVLSPALTDTDATNAMRFIWGDRDAVMGSAATQANQKYLGLKLGDTFHSTPALVGAPGSYAYFTANKNGYADYYAKYHYRRRVLFAGANDGLLHAFDIGAWNRTPSACSALSTGVTASCYDRGTGAELFAYAPRAIMQIYKPLKDAVDAQTNRDEWTVDGSPTAADVYIDPVHNGTPTASDRTWQTVLVGGMREGSPFEGLSGASPYSSRGSYYALNITQPDELTASNGVTTIATGTFNAPKCLNASGDATCARDWPTVMWEISDTTDADAVGATGNGYGDMGETWSKPAIGIVRICTASCGTTSATYDEKHVAVFGGGFDRERKNRRGNWLYIVDIETGNVLLKANSSCGVNASAGCTPTYFGSMPADPAALDFNGDGVLDVVYIGDNKGQMWRIDLSDLRYQTGYSSARFANKIDFTTGSPKPFLLFQAPQTVSNQFYPIYFPPSVIFLADGPNGTPTVGLAWGTGDRDDIIAAIDPTSTTYPQRFYYVVDSRQTVTRTESDLTIISSPTASALTSVPANGWAMKFTNGERTITEALTINGVILFGTFSPLSTGGTGGTCGNATRCGQPSGTARYYQMAYATGNPVGGTRGSIVPNAQFITSTIAYQSGNNKINTLFMTSGGGTGGGTSTTPTSATIKEWRER